MVASHSEIKFRKKSNTKGSHMHWCGNVKRWFVALFFYYSKRYYSWLLHLLGKCQVQVHWIQLSFSLEWISLKIFLKLSYSNEKLFFISWNVLILFSCWTTWIFFMNLKSFWNHWFKSHMWLSLIKVYILRQINTILKLKCQPRNY